MIDICCVGHITSDKVVNPASVVHMPGGTAWYFSQAIAKLDLNYLLATSLAPAEMHYVQELAQKGIAVNAKASNHTVYFENIYGDNPDDRTQNVLETADAFTVEQVADLDARIFHLGPLLADDIAVDFIRFLSGKGQVSLDVQGYLRKVVNHKVYPTGWAEKQEALQYIDIVKADEAELKALTGMANVRDGAMQLADWGVKEVVITNGSHGSLIYNIGVFYTIPAYPPEVIVDATGCGDTYMAGYLYKRVKGVNIQDAGEFAAAMAALKMESAGPFLGDEKDVNKFLSSR